MSCLVGSLSLAKCTRQPPPMSASVKDAINDASKAVLKGGKDMKGLHNFISEIRNYIFAPHPTSVTHYRARH